MQMNYDVANAEMHRTIFGYNGKDFYAIASRENILKDLKKKAIERARIDATFMDRITGKNLEGRVDDK